MNCLIHSVESCKTDKRERERERERAGTAERQILTSKVLDVPVMREVSSYITV